MYQGINTTANPYLIRCNYYDTILTFLNGDNFAHCRYKDCAINTGLYQGILYDWIDINIALLTTEDTQATPVLIVLIQVSISLYIHTLI